MLGLFVLSVRLSVKCDSFALKALLFVHVAGMLALVFAEESGGVGLPLNAVAAAQNTSFPVIVLQFF